MSGWTKASMPALAALHLVICAFHVLIWHAHPLRAMLHEWFAAAHWVGLAGILSAFAAAAWLLRLYVVAAVAPWRVAPATMSLAALATLPGAIIGGLLR